MSFQFVKVIGWLGFSYSSNLHFQILTCLKSFYQSIFMCTSNYAVDRMSPFPKHTTFVKELWTMVSHLDENLSIIAARCALVLVTHFKKMHEKIIFIVNWRVSVANCPKTTTKNPFDNHNDLLTHLFALSLIGQVATDGCIGQVSFQWMVTYQ